jgi:RimJ/RimL family protein N-acetyltransferase
VGPQAQSRGVAVDAVRHILEHIREHRIETRAAARVDPDNIASVRVAKKSGFTYVHDLTSGTAKQPDGTPAMLQLYVHDV